MQFTDNIATYTLGFKKSIKSIEYNIKEKWTIFMIKWCTFQYVNALAQPHWRHSWSQQVLTPKQNQTEWHGGSKNWYRLYDSNSITAISLSKEIFIKWWLCKVQWFISLYDSYILRKFIKFQNQAKIKCIFKQIDTGLSSDNYRATFCWEKLLQELQIFITLEFCQE